MGTVIKMYAAVAGSAEPAIAQMDVPAPGHIIGIEWAIRVVLTGTDFFFECQAAFRSAASFTTNDDRGVISEVALQYDITTSGTAVIAPGHYTQLPDLPVMGGERIYLHSNSTAATVGVIKALLHFDFDLDKVSMRRR